MTKYFFLPIEETVGSIEDTVGGISTVKEQKNKVLLLK